MCRYFSSSNLTSIVTRLRRRITCITAWWRQNHDEGANAFIELQMKENWRLQRKLREEMRRLQQLRKI